MQIEKNKKGADFGNSCVWQLLFSPLKREKNRKKKKNSKEDIKRHKFQMYWTRFEKIEKEDVELSIASTKPFSNLLPSL